MTKENRGKQFEVQIREALERVPNCAVTRLYDPMGGYIGVANSCDFIVYKYPYQYYIECKSCYGNTMSIHSNPKKGKDGKLRGFYGNITDTQWEGLLKQSKIVGVKAGVIIWFIDKDTTVYVPIQVLQSLRDNGFKSIKADEAPNFKDCVLIPGKKRKVLYDYDMRELIL